MTLHVIKASSPFAQLVLENAPESDKQYYYEKLEGKNLRNYSTIIYVQKRKSRQTGKVEEKPMLLAYVPNRKIVRTVAENVAEYAEKGTSITVYGKDDEFYISAIKAAFAKRARGSGTVCRIDIRRNESRSWDLTTIIFQPNKSKTKPS